MGKQTDVVALGELLVDFTENGISGQGNPLFEANPGGAPCNVLAMLRKLDYSVSFIGKVGDDIFGRMLRDTIRAAGIDDTGLLTDMSARTTLAFVKTLPGGDRDFSFYRHPGADMMLRADELPEELIRNARVLHFGTLSMTHEGVRAATMRAVELAKTGGALISFDPNLRLPLWKSEEEAKEMISWGLGQCDILKIADNEVRFMTGQTDLDAGADILRQKYPDIRILNVTSGADGSCCYHEGRRVSVPAFRLGGTIETTGAGDTFCAGVLHYVLGHGISGLAEEQMTEMLRFANAAAYLVTTRKGAIRSMPEKPEVDALLAGQQ